MDTRLLTRLGTLRQLEIFLKVAELQSIMRAAESLYLSHSAVSVQIGKLATAMGMPLHEVIGKKLHLTEAGREVAATGHELFSVIRSLDQKLNDLKGLNTGSFRISVVSTAMYFLPRLLGPFCRDYPSIEVEFLVGNRAQIIDRLDRNLDDVYIFSDPPDEPSIQCTPFLPNPLVVIASSQNPLARRKRLAWNDLAGQKFLLRERGSGTDNAIQSYLEKHQLSMGKTMIIESNEAIKYAVIENMGITILSAYALENARKNSLVQLPVAGFPISTQWHFVHLKEKKLSLITQRFLEFVLTRGREVLPMKHIEKQLQRALSK